MEFACPSCHHQGESSDFDPHDEAAEGLDYSECPNCGYWAESSEFELETDNSIICPDCGGEFDPDECANCPHCEAEVVQCCQCGEVIEDDPHVDITGGPVCEYCHLSAIHDE